MPTISRRSERAYSSAIRKLTPYADRAKAAGKHVWHLNIGQPDLETPPEALQALREHMPAVVAYTASRGLLSYRTKLSEYYARFGATVSADEIVITNGGSEAIYFTMMSCLDRGDEVLSPEPLYAIYNGFAESAGVKIKPLTTYIENGFALPDSKAIEAAITPKTKAILLCNPNNPTGTLYAKKDILALAKIAKAHNLYLFVDEVYREFCYNEAPYFSALCMDEMRDNVVVIDSISKRFSACGVRIGALVTRNQAIIQAANRYAEYRLSPSLLGQIFAEATLDIGPEYFQQVRDEYKDRRDLLIKRLRAMPGVVCPQPEGAFYVVVKLPVDNADKFCRWLLETFSHQGETVMLAPAEGFYATKGLGKQEVRIAYVLNTEHIDRAMDCLEAALKQYKK